MSRQGRRAHSIMARSRLRSVREAEDTTAVSTRRATLVPRPVCSHRLDPHRAPRPPTQNLRCRKRSIHRRCFRLTEESRYDSPGGPIHRGLESGERRIRTPGSLWFTRGAGGLDLRRRLSAHGAQTEVSRVRARSSNRTITPPALQQAKEQQENGILTRPALRRSAPAELNR